MVFIIKPTLANSRIEFDEDLQFYPVKPEFLMVLSHLIGYNETNDYTDLLRIDGNGNLLVSSEGVASEELTTSKATVTSSGDLVVSARANRKSLTLYNEGNETVYLSSTNPSTVASGFVLPASASLDIDNFVGALYGIVATNDCDVRVAEWV